MRRHCQAILLCASFGIAYPVAANDSIGHLAAGGIELARTNDIEMRSEDLYVSVKEIKVRYRFYNRSGTDISSLVAFPMPEIPAPSEMQLVALPHEDQDNIFAFESKTDGVAQDVKLEQRAIALGIDRTELLRSLGVPLQPHAKKTEEALAALGKDKLGQLLALGLIRAEDMDSMAGASPVFFPNWSLRATYYWVQVFPAQKEIVIEHRYEPSVGASSGTMVGYPNLKPGALDDYKRRYCMDDGFMSAAAKAHAAAVGAKGYGFGERRIGYVLTTGSNWAGPIKSFKLTIDKGQPDTLVSFCGEGVRKISPTTFEMTKSDYWPQADLEVLLLARF